MDWLTEICEEHGKTIYWLIQETKIPRATLYRLDNNYIDDLKLSNCELIANALGMTTVEFMIKYYDKYKKED